MGDETSKGKIYGFSVLDGEMYASVEYSIDNGRRTVCESVAISKVQKAKKKVLLFLTEDGKDIFEGQSYAYTPRESLGWVNVSDGKSTPMPKDGFLYFSTKEKAEEYILRNKPLLSLQDLLNVWDIDDRFQKEDKGWYAQSPMFKTFKQLAKSKMDGKK